MEKMMQTKSLSLVVEGAKDGAVVWVRLVRWVVLPANLNFRDAFAKAPFPQPRLDVLSQEKFKTSTAK